MNIPIRAALALSLSIALAGCGGPPPASPPLEGARIGGPFTLTNQNGGRVSDSAFAGRYRLIYFGYTFCPDVCPTDLQHLMAGLKRFEAADAARAAKVQPIFITVDPERDSPVVLRDYVAAFHPRLIGLTGTPTEIARVAKAYAINYAKVQEPGTTGYLMEHGRIALLMGPKGEPIAIIPQDGTPQAIEKELSTWVR